MEIYGGCWSEIGCRTVNQDAVIYRQLEQNGQYFVICAVCDGVGGLEHGEAASLFLVDGIAKWFDSVAEWLDIEQVNPGVLFSHLKDAAELWNEGVLFLCREQGIRTGSTMSLLMLIRDCYYIIHVGDSRVYRYLDRLERLTQDASIARVKAGRVKNYLENFMGKGENLWFQSVEGSLEGREMFVVCSDGAYHHLTERDIGELYKSCLKYGEAEFYCSQVVKRMLERGERDNASLGIVLISGAGEE